jgi:hypothetical protein
VDVFPICDDLTDGMLLDDYRNARTCQIGSLTPTSDTSVFLPQILVYCYKILYTMSTTTTQHESTVFRVNLMLCCEFMKMAD